MKLRYAAAVLAFAASPTFAQSATEQEMAAGGDSITIGAAAAYIPDYEGSNDYRIVPAPGAIGSVSGFAFTLAGNRASVDLIPNKPGPVWDFQAGPVAVLDFNRSSVKSIDDVRISGSANSTPRSNSAAMSASARPASITCALRQIVGQPVVPHRRQRRAPLQHLAAVGPVFHPAQHQGRGRPGRVGRTCRHRLCPHLFRRHRRAESRERPAGLQRDQRVEELERSARSARSR